MTNKRGRKVKLYTFGGQSLSLHQWANITGVNPDTIRARLDRGWPFAKAAVQPVAFYAVKASPKANKPNRAKHYTAFGKTMNLTDWAKAVGISSSTLHERVAQFRWPLERALTEPVLSNSARAIIRHNRIAIHRMAQAFRSHATTPIKTPNTTHTGGYNQTFARGYGTGVGRRLPDLQSSGIGMDRQ